MIGQPLKPKKDSIGSSNDRSVIRAGQILKAFSDTGNQDLGISEIAARTDLSLSTAHRIVRSLVDIGLLAQNNATGKYKLGNLVIDLGRQATDVRGLDIQAYPEMQSLVDDTGEGVNLGVLVRQRVVYVQRIFGHHPLRTDFPVGTDVPVHCSAIGKSILAFSENSTVEDCIQYDFKPRTAHTLNDLDMFWNQLRGIQKSGYSIDREEFIEGITCIGAPIFAGKRVIAGLAVQAPSSRMTEQVIAHTIPKVIHAAENISRSIM